MTLKTFFPLKFSTTMMETAHRCQTAFFREYIQHLTNHAKNSDLIAGGHIAKACEIVRTSYFTEGIDEYEAIERGKEYIINSEDTGDDVKSNLNVAYCLGKYFQKFKLSEALPPCALADGTHAVEYKFDIDLGIQHPDIPDRTISYTGRLDYLCENVSVHGTTRHGLDEKTCKQVYLLKGTRIRDYKKEADKYRTNGQILDYAWAAEKLGVPLTSFFIRRIPIMSKFEESFELEIPFTAYAIAARAKANYTLISDLVEKYKIYKDFYENENRPFQDLFIPTNQELSCMSYSRPCKYMEGCLSKDGEALLMEQFSQRIYDRDTRTEMYLSDYLKGITNGN